MYRYACEMMLQEVFATSHFKPMEVPWLDEALARPANKLDIEAAV